MMLLVNDAGRSMMLKMRGWWGLVGIMRVIARLFLKLAIGLSMIPSHCHQAHMDSVRGEELSNDC